MARDLPRESRLFANEMLQGAPHIADALAGPLRALVDEKAAAIRAWARAGRIAPVDPHHLIFSIWAATQHYADFDVQVRAVLGRDDARRFDDAARLSRPPLHPRPAALTRLLRKPPPDEGSIPAAAFGAESKGQRWKASVKISHVLYHMSEIYTQILIFQISSRTWPSI